MTHEHLAKLQSGKATAKLAGEQAWSELHAQAYVDLLRCRAQNDVTRSEHLSSEPSFLNID